METKVEALEGNRIKVTVTVEGATIAERMKKKYKEVANQYNIPGFRRGKAPRPVIDSALGKDYVRALVTDDVISETMPLAMDEGTFYPVGKPELDQDADLVEDKTDYSYSFEIETKPAGSLTSYDPVEIEMPAEDVDDEQIEEEIDALREHYVEIVDAPANTKVKEDKYVQMKVSATDDKGEEIASLKEDSIEYGIGSGVYPKEFDEQIIGLKKGDSKQFTIDTPAEATAATATVMGKTTTITFDVEIQAVKKKKLPELTDEWVMTKIGLDNVEALRNELREEIASQKQNIFPRLKESRALQALADRFEGEVPDGIVEDAEANLMQDFFNQLQRSGLTLDMYLQQAGITSSQFRDDIKEQARDMTKQDLAIDAWAANAGIEATEEEIRKEFEEAGTGDPEALMEDWRRNGQMHLIRQGIIRQKAAKEIVDNAIVTEEKPEAVEEKTGKHAKADESEEEDVEVIEIAEEAEEAVEAE